MDVGTGDVDNRADGGRNSRLLPDVESLGDGVRTGVAAALALDGSDQRSKLSSRAVAVHNSLVANNHELDNVPLSPGGNGIDLALDIGSLIAAAVTLDEDTENEIKAVLLSSTTNILKSVAVSRVDTDDLEASVLEVGNILLDLGSGLAVSSGRLIRSVGDTVVVVAAGQTTARSLRLRLRLRGSLGRLGLGNDGRRNVDRRSAAGLRSNRRSVAGGSRSRSGLSSGQARALEGAPGDIASLGDGDHFLGGGVGTRSIAGGDGVDDDRRLRDRGGDRSNGVSSRNRAEVGGLDDNAGDNGATGRDGSNGAGDGGGRLNDGGNTTNSVRSWGHLGRGSTADGGAIGQGDGGGRDGVGSRSREGDGSRCWDWNNNHLGS